MFINGSGNYVDSMQGQAYTYDMYLYGPLQLHGPGGYSVNSANEVWNNNTLWVLTNNLDKYMDTGTYCVTWWEDTSGKYVDFTSACESVE